MEKTVRNPLGGATQTLQRWEGQRLDLVQLAAEEVQAHRKVATNAFIVGRLGIGRTVRLFACLSVNCTHTQIPACPNAGQNKTKSFGDDGGGSSMSCFSCGQEGHFSSGA